MLSRFIPQMFNPLTYYRLILSMTKREVIGRYRGSFLGLFWSFITPILMLSIYTFVFGFVFKARWGQGQADQYNFALILFTGLIIFNLFSECLSRAPNLILSNVNYVKKVVFPLEILPWISLGAALFHATTSFFILLIGLVVMGHEFNWVMLFAPIIIFPLLLLIMGLSWLLASIGVFVRDINQVITMLLSAMMFMCPIFYPLSALPESARDFLFLNPLTLIIEEVRAVLIWGVQPNWIYLGYYFVISLFVYIVGWSWFAKTRKGFSDVL